jgi:hypothetical protein
MALPVIEDQTGDGHGGPATDAFGITLSDSINLAVKPRALLVGVAGNLKVTMASGSIVILPVPAGYNPIRVTRVWSTGSTATGIFGLL